MRVCRKCQSLDVKKGLFEGAHVLKSHERWAVQGKMFLHLLQLHKNGFVVKAAFICKI